MTRANAIALTVILAVVLVFALFAYDQQAGTNNDTNTRRIATAFCESEGLDC